MTEPSKVDPKQDDKPAKPTGAQRLDDLERRVTALENRLA